MITMPTMKPLPIKTKGFSFAGRMWALVTVTRKWELTDNYFYTLPDGTRIVIPAGFVHDGASIPKILWGILSPTGLLLIAALIHDFSYRYGYLWVVDEKTGDVKKWVCGTGSHTDYDDLFLKINLEVNGMVLVDHLAAFMLAVFGGIAWREHRLKNIPGERPVI